MEVHVVETIDIIIAVKCTAENRGAVVIISYHLLVLCLRIPTDIVAKIYPTHTNGIKIVIIRVAVLPDVLFLEGVENGQAAIGFMAHQVMVLAIPPRHFDLMFVREHANLFKALMCTPYDERNLVTNGSLHREYRLSRKNRPIDAAELSFRGGREFFFFFLGVGFFFK